jgi:hypothetical protein
MDYYFRLYLTSLIELQQFEEADDQIQKEINKQQAPNPEFLIHWGYVLKAQKKIREGQEKYEQAIGADSTQ